MVAVSFSLGAPSEHPRHLITFLPSLHHHHLITSLSSPLLPASDSSPEGCGFDSRLGHFRDATHLGGSLGSTPSVSLLLGPIGLGA